MAELIAAQVASSAAVKHGDKRLPDIQVLGTTANYPQLFSVDLAAGRYFLDAEARGSQALAVIGGDIKDELFPHGDPIGRQALPPVAIPAGHPHLHGHGAGLRAEAEHDPQVALRQVTAA